MIDSTFIAPFCTVGLYGIATLWQARQLILGQATGPRGGSGVTVFGSSAWLLHSLIVGFMLYQQSSSHALTIAQVMNLISLSVTGLLLLAAKQKPLANLFVLMFPLNALSLLLLQFVPGVPLTALPYGHLEILHISLSIIAFSVLFAAALQAILLAAGEYSLRTKRVTHSLAGLPPLQTMENLLFQLILIGFILLSIVLVTSVLSFAELTSGILFEKTVLTLSAWGVFLLLLLGRFFKGWRGQTAIKGTLLGMFVLMLSYFGTKLLWVN